MIRILTTAVALFGFLLSVAAHAVLGNDVVARVNAATFEVLVPKPKSDSQTYERPLPLDLLPYSVRSDNYYSIGTAFAIAPDRFVSAAHVIDLDSATQYEGYYLRDRNGKVYEIDKIVKYSSRQDFIVFTVKGGLTAAPLAINTAPKINDKVFAVGNALGEGVVIRDGLYTSSTPEEREGKWKWIRFSAAASPGNSGGPLLDTEGRVIGIVLRKSESENLNFALPIGDVMAAADKAVLDRQLIYRLDNMEMTRTGILKKEIDLPRDYRVLHKELTVATEKYADSLLDELLAQYRNQIFPNGPGSERMLNNTFSAIFPHLIAKDRDGNWEVYKPEKTQSADLGHNGHLSFGLLGSSVFFYMHKPDDVTLGKLYSDSRLVMDLFLRGAYITRQVGPEKVRVTSLGAARTSAVHNDRYGRRWQVYTWNREFNDEQLMMFALPVPGGYVGMIRASNTGIASGHMADLRVLSDFFYLTYYGTLAEWRDLLAQRDRLPVAFSALKFDYNGKDKLSLKTGRFSLDGTRAPFALTPNSDLALRFSYFREDSKVVWDVAEAILGEDRNRQTFVQVARYIKPPKVLGDKEMNHWENLVNSRWPYNAEAFPNEKLTVVSRAQSPAKKETPIRYAVTYGREGTEDAKKMKSALEKFGAGVKILE